MKVKTAEEIILSVIGIRLDAGNLTPMDKGECILCINEAIDQFKPKWVSVEDGLPEIDESDTWKKQQGHSKTVPVIEQGNLFFGWYNYQMNAWQVVGRVGNIQVSKWFNLPDHE